MRVQAEQTPSGHLVYDDTIVDKKFSSLKPWPIPDSRDPRLNPNQIPRGDTTFGSKARVLEYLSRNSLDHCAGVKRRKMIIQVLDVILDLSAGVVQIIAVDEVDHQVGLGRSCLVSNWIRGSRFLAPIAPHLLLRNIFPPAPLSIHRQSI